MKHAIQLLGGLPIEHSHSARIGRSSATSWQTQASRSCGNLGALLGSVVALVPETCGEKLTQKP